MGKVITDNSKVNQNLLAENKKLTERVESLQLENEKLKKALSLSDVGQSFKCKACKDRKVLTSAGIAILCHCQVTK